MSYEKNGKKKKYIYIYSTIKILLRCIRCVKKEKRLLLKEGDFHRVLKIFLKNFFNRYMMCMRVM